MNPITEENLKNVLNFGKINDYIYAQEIIKELPFELLKQYETKLFLKIFSTYNITRKNTDNIFFGKEEKIKNILATLDVYIKYTKLDSTDLDLTFILDQILLEDPDNKKPLGSIPYNKSNNYRVIKHYLTKNQTTGMTRLDYLHKNNYITLNNPNSVFHIFQMKPIKSVIKWIKKNTPKEILSELTTNRKTKQQQIPTWFGVNNKNTAELIINNVDINQKSMNGMSFLMYFFIKIFINKKRHTATTTVKELYSPYYCVSDIMKEKDYSFSPDQELKNSKINIFDFLFSPPTHASNLTFTTFVSFFSKYINTNEIDISLFSKNEKNSISFIDFLKNQENITSDQATYSIKIIDLLHHKIDYSKNIENEILYDIIMEHVDKIEKFYDSLPGYTKYVYKDDILQTKQIKQKIIFLNLKQTLETQHDKTETKKIKL